MKRIGRYEITGELGRGAMGVVFRAQDPVIGRILAIKTIRLGELTDASEATLLRDRLFREARSAGILSHPHIVTVYDMGEDKDIAFIAMEFVSGATLHDLIRRDGAIDRKLLLSMLHEMASALDYAHARGIVHRDVKPGNIMIDEAGKAKMADFGIAKILSQNATQTEMVLGTPSYMSPEQIESRNLDGRSDQFALAVIAYELLTGEKPFAAQSLPALLFKIVRDAAEPAHQINPSLSPAVSEALARAMAKDREARFPTCTEFVTALSDGLVESPNWKPLAKGAAANLPTSAFQGPEQETSGASISPAGNPAPSPVSSGTMTPAAAPPGPAQAPDFESAIAQVRPPTLTPATLKPAAPPVPSAAQPVQPPPYVPPPLATHGPSQMIPRRRQQEAQAAEKEEARTITEKRLPNPAPPVVAAPPVPLSLNTPPLDAAPRGNSYPAMVKVAGVIVGAAAVLAAFLVAKMLFAPAAPPPDPAPIVDSGPSVPETPSAPNQNPTRPNVAKTPDKPSPTGSPVSSPDKSSSTAAPVEVDFASSPSGATVKVTESGESCTTPCKLPVAAGRHVLNYTLAGYRSAVGIIMVPAETRSLARLDQLMGTLMANTTPAQAEVYIDGQLQNQKTPAILKLPAGQHRLELKLAGYKDHVRQIDIEDGGVSNIDVKWVAVP